MLAGLEAALASRKKFVDAHADTTTAEGTAENTLDDQIKSRGGGWTSFNTRSETGRTGLQNQGATCYLDSLLQSLFMTPGFRRALYRWQFDECVHGDAARCVPLQLQSLFARLQLTEQAAVTTTALTKSFGWSGAESFVQQDVGECLTQIFTCIETVCAGTPPSAHINGEWKGILLDYVMPCSGENLAECDVRSRADVFQSLLLDIRGKHTLDECLRSHALPEVIEGVETPSTGVKADHFKGLKIQQLPRILVLQLKRFDMDYNTFQRIKLNDAIEFPELLDVSPYVDSRGHEGLNAAELKAAVAAGDDTTATASENNNEPMEYELMSSLIHIGSAHAGHYYAYIRDTASGRWLHFNDSFVDYISEEDLEIALGSAARNNRVDPIASLQRAWRASKNDAPKAVTTSPKITGPPPPPQPRGMCQGETGAARKRNLAASSTNAYMLVYRRVAPTNANEVPDGEVPEAIAEKVRGENAVFREKKAEFDLERQHVKMKLFHGGRSFGLRMHQDETVASFTRLAFDTVVGAEQQLHTGEPLADLDISLDRVRLRNFDVIKNIALAPLGEPDAPLSTVPRERLERPLQFEIRVEGEPFELFVEGGFILNLVLWRRGEDADTVQARRPTQISIVDDPVTVGALRRVAAEQMGGASIRLVCLQMDVPLVLTDDDATLASLRVVTGDLVHVEVIAAADDDGGGDSSSSAVLTHFDGVVNLISISFHHKPSAAPESNEPASGGALPPPPPPLPTLPADATTGVDAAAAAEAVISVAQAQRAVEVDRRQPLSVLKAAIATKIGLDESQFKLRQASRGGVEIKDLSQSLSACGLDDTSSVFVEEGTPLCPGQFAVQVVRLSSTPEGEGAEAAAVEKDDALEPLGHMVLHEDDAVGSVKEAVVAAGFTYVQERERLRLRTVAAGRMVEVLHDGRSVRECCRHTLRDGMMLGVQELAAAEHFTEDHVLVAIQHWHPEENALDPSEEIALLRSATLMDLKARLAPLAGTEEWEDVRVVKPFRWQLKDQANVPKLKWSQQPSPDTELLKSPWRLRTGDLLCFARFKDMCQHAQGGDGGGSGGGDGDAAAAASSSAPERALESGFRIYTPDEQIQREEKKRAEMEIAAKELEQRMGAVAAAAREMEPDLARFVKLYQMGMPLEQVQDKMKREGLEPGLLLQGANGGGNDGNAR